MTGEQPSLRQAEQLGFRVFAQRTVRRVRDFLIADAAVERRAAVAEDFVVHFRTELLRAEEHDIEVTATRGDVDQRIAQCVLRAAGSVLVQLVNEDDDLVDAECCIFCFSPNFLNDS